MKMNRIFPSKDMHIHDYEAWRHFRWRYLLSVWVLLTTIASVFIVRAMDFSLKYIVIWFLVWTTMALLLLLPCFAVYTLVQSQFKAPVCPASEVQKYIEFNNSDFAANFGYNFDQRVPIETIHEAYFDEKINFKMDLLEALRDRNKFADFRLTWNHCKFFCRTLIPELLIHSRSQDRAQVTEHYNRGNDFFNSFLGPMMIYTSAFYKGIDDTLEEAQTHKLDLICRKLHLQPEEQLLDLGCGWGTLLCHAAKHYGVHTTGITLAAEQVKWANEQAVKYGVADRVNPIVSDYRDTPKRRWNKISCLEMAEHVGIRLFSSFLGQVYDMLEDDGLFYLQIAGLRRSWQWEDLSWGLFMDKYVFPGADASTPVWWVIEELEKTGFEVHSVENVGIHYSKTIHHWYDNWVSNKPYILEHYGERWFRVWAWFLAWSVIIAEQGSSTCYQIVCHKNLGRFDRDIYIGEHSSFEY